MTGSQVIHHVAVLLGGPSAEHDVSLVSGRAIANALAGRGHVVSAWLIDLDGRWWQLPPTALDATCPATAYDEPAGLEADGPHAAAVALARIAAEDPRPVVFPALHGPFGEDGVVQSLLESVWLVCCGSGPAASAVGMDKTLFKRVCCALDLPVLPWREIEALDHERDPRAIIGQLESFARGLPDPRLIIKPTRMGSSIGVTIVQRPDEPPELEYAVGAAFDHDDRIFAEPYLDHPRELEVAVVGNGRHDLEVFGPGEIVPGREFYDYIAKYRSDASRSVLAPALDPAIAAAARRIAGEAFLAIGATGFARVDFLLSREQQLFISEINTIPGFTPISLFPQLCAEGGYPFAGICERIVELAIEHDAHRPVRRLTRALLP